jgi:hypothetical protein
MNGQLDMKLTRLERCFFHFEQQFSLGLSRQPTGNLPIRSLPLFQASGYQTTELTVTLQDHKSSVKHS